MLVLELIIVLVMRLAMALVLLRNLMHVILVLETLVIFLIFARQAGHLRVIVFVSGHPSGHLSDRHLDVRHDSA